MTLTEKQRAFLEAPRFAVAATISTDGLPHQTVVWYALDGNDELVVSTPRGSLKHRHLLRDPRLSLCVAAFNATTLPQRRVVLSNLYPRPLSLRRPSVETIY